MVRDARAASVRRVARVCRLRPKKRCQNTMVAVRTRLSSLRKQLATGGLVDELLARQGGSEKINSSVRAFLFRSEALAPRRRPPPHWLVALLFADCTSARLDARFDARLTEKQISQHLQETRLGNHRHWLVERKRAVVVPPPQHFLRQPGKSGAGGALVHLERAVVGVQKPALSAKRLGFVVRHHAAERLGFASAVSELVDRTTVQDPEEEKAKKH